MIPSRPPTSSRRLWRVSARTALLIIALLIVLAFATDRIWVRGNGIVAGQLTAIAPIVQARLKQVFANCLDHVVRGQRLAEFENEATAEAAAQQMQQLQLQLTLARAEISIAESEAEAARNLVDAQAALRDQLAAVLKAEDSLAKKQFVAELVWEQIKANLAQAKAETNAAQYVYQTKKADQKKAELAVEVLQQQIQSFQNSPELNGDFYLTAPDDGVLTECTGLPGAVIPAGKPVFQLFNPHDVYAVVFFDPSDAARLKIGDKFSISVGGINGTVNGRVAGFYPELSALPASLTRFFWQQETWSQYAPVRLNFDGLNNDQESKLFAWAQLSAWRAQLWPSGIVTGFLESTPVRWVRNNVDFAWSLVSSAFAESRASP